MSQPTPADVPAPNGSEREARLGVPSAADRTAARTKTHRARLVAAIAGVLGVLLAVAVPFLPVQQRTAQLSWPTVAAFGPDGEGSITAPLTAQVPTSLHATIGRGAFSELPAQGGIAFATAPAAGAEAPREAMFVRVSDTSVDVLNRNEVLASAPRAAAASERSDGLQIDSDATGTTVTFLGLTSADGPDITGHSDKDVRPQVVGLFTDLRGAVPDGTHVTVDIDSRFTSTPTLIKSIALWGAGIATVVAVLALRRLDNSDNRRSRGFLPKSWWRVGPIDAVVVGVLALWHFIGANTSDDGYLLTMARVSEHAGYMANYFRWYGVPEAPFGWYYEVLAVMSRISTASPFIRLAALAAGIVSWWLISREVVPRLGRAVRTNRVALWTAGFVFLAFWLPYNNGLRPEPIVALGALLTWCLVERSIATRRLFPAALAIAAGAFTLAAAPTGLMCVAILLAGVRPIVRTVVRRHRLVGTLPLVAPMVAAGTVVLAVVFADQTLQTVLEATRVRTAVGPNLEWYNDFLRYYYLMVPEVDGSLARRFAFLTMILCLITVTVVLLRRRQVPGVPKGPAWRLVLTVFGTMFFMMFNPTKWTHHFGAYAGIAGSLAALTAVVVSAQAVRSRRNRTVFAAGLLFVLALSFASINGYWYVSSYGVPWFDKTVRLGPLHANAVFLAAFFAVALLAGWQYLREGFAPAMPKASSARGQRIRTFAGIPLTVFAGAMVLFEVLSLAKGAVSQYPAYSLARSNFQALTGKTCGLANDVLVESDVNSGLLQPIPGQPESQYGPIDDGSSRGFSPNGVPDDISADAVAVTPGASNTSSQTVGLTYESGANAGTEGGSGARGINGSTVKLPFGLDPARVPVLGSYQPTVQEPAHATSSWYALPERSDERPLLTFSAAGRIKSIDIAGAEVTGQSLVVEAGRRNPDGTVTPVASILPRDIGPTPSWRNLRVAMSEVPADADVVRINADDPDLTGDQWLAFTPPRVPELTTLNDYLGDQEPVLLDWAVGLQFPCQRPFNHYAGVAEMPRYRILPDRPLAVTSTDTWQNEKAGGPLGWAEMLAGSKTIPTYLKDDWARDWGSLEEYEPYFTEATPATPTYGTKEQWGFTKEPEIRVHEE